MTRKATPNGTRVGTLSLDNRVWDMIDQLPSGTRSERVNEILISNATLLGMDQQEADQLLLDLIHMRLLPKLRKALKEWQTELLNTPPYEWKDLLGGK